LWLRLCKNPKFNAEGLQTGGQTRFWNKNTTSGRNLADRGKNRVKTDIWADIVLLLGQFSQKTKISCVHEANDEATETRDVGFSGVFK
jgi:hypothetical protein